MQRCLTFLVVLGLVLTTQAQRVGLVLSGGGAVGLTHIGVIKALEENDIPIDYITGSSMGALVGAMYASGFSPAQMDSLFQTDLYQLMARGEVEEKHVYFFKQNTPDASLFDIKFNVDTTLQTSLPTNLRSPVLTDWEQMVNFSRATAASGGDMDSLFVPFRCVASDITAQRAVVFEEGDLALAVRASMSYPFYFKPIRVNGHLMMDGGMYNNFPSDVMYESFMPDVILGSNVAFNAAPPSEDDLMSQLRALMMEKTNYTVPCDPGGLIIQPRTATTLFDFSTAKQAVQDGYAAAMARMPEIKALIERRAAQSEVKARRAAFTAKFPEMVVGSITWKGLTPAQALYTDHLVNKSHEPLTAAELKPRYFRLYADHSISGLFPKATYVPERGNFDLEVLAKRSKQLEVRVGGLLSSRSVNTGMVGLRYHFFNRVSSRVEATSYFGKYYAAGQLKVRTDLSTRLPIYVEPVFTLHRWDWFSGFATFFDETKPSYIVMREEWTGVNVGLGLGNKGLVRGDLKYVHSRDEYYQTADFGSKDTADATDFYHATTGVLIERNSLNRKQHANMGDRLFGEMRYVGGDEVTIPGSTFNDRLPRRQHHDWFIARASIEKYFLPRGHVRFGLMAEGVYSTQSFFQNYTESLIKAPVFQPTPESRTYFIENFRATQYLAGGARAIIAVAKNKFDLRFEGYVFQPYKPILRSNTDEATEGRAISERSYLASGSLIWQSPLGPLWFNTSYIDGLDKPWQVSLNFGYVIFAQRAGE